MTNDKAALDSADRFNLKRFVEAQAEIYETALVEIRNGNKQSHWMWFIFPQFAGLGLSATSKFYAIASIEEAKAYLKHPILGLRLIECCCAILDLVGRSASEIFGYPDDLKFHSSVTLFAAFTPPGYLFEVVLNRFFNCVRDEKTLQLISETG